MADEVVSATDARRQLWRALVPVYTLMGEAGRNPRIRARLRYAVQLHPLVVQITKAPDEGRPARHLASVVGTCLPDRGAALAAAAETFAAGVLAGLRESAVVATVATAAVLGGGGLFVFMDPSDEAAILALAEPGRSLSEATILGAILDAPETSH